MREEIINYSAEHPNDFGFPDGRDRIPMKKLMKLFGIKKKTAPETQNLFRELVNECCDLEIKEEIGKVLVLKPELQEELQDDSSTDYGDSDDDEPDYGYGEATPTISETVGEADSDGEAEAVRRTTRFRPPKASASGGLMAISSSRKETFGLSDETRPRYRRRGSVTRYSIVGHEQVRQEYQKNEDIINQFRRDSLKLEHSMRNLNLGSGSNHSTSKNDDGNHNGTSNANSKKQVAPLQEKKKENPAMKFLGKKGRGRFSLHF